jgi:Tol biopolymer transport system component
VERVVTEIRKGEGFPSPPYLTWCPESNCLVATDYETETVGPLCVVSLETGEKRILTHPPEPSSDIHPAISPDGRSLAFRRHKGSSIGELYWARLGKGMFVAEEPHRLTPVELDANYPTWMPAGNEILFSSKGALWRLSAPGDGPPSRLPFVGDDGVMPAVARPQPGRPSRLVYVRSFQDFNIWRIDTSGANAPELSSRAVAIASTRVDQTPSFSPDGRRVAFASSRSGNFEIWLADPDGSNPVQLTSMGVSSNSPNWSPDGRVIAFHSNLEATWRVFLVPAAGGKPRPVAPNGWPSFSSDSQWVYFGSARSGSWQIWKVAATGGDAAQVTRDGGNAARESTDGRSVYYTRAGNGVFSLWRMPVSGGQTVKVLDGIARETDFAVVEKGIYYIRNSGGENRLEFFSFAGARSALVAGNLGKTVPGLTASPDGRTVLYSRLDSSVDDLMLVENFR